MISVRIRSVFIPTNGPHHLTDAWARGSPHRCELHGAARSAAPPPASPSRAHGVLLLPPLLSPSLVDTDLGTPGLVILE